jgi:hypothetical protein
VPHAWIVTVCEDPAKPLDFRAKTVYSTCMKKKTATLNTAELRLALVTWRSELLSLGNKYPENFPYPTQSNRLEALDAALLAIDGSFTVKLSQATTLA